MNYPVWELWFGPGLLIAIVAISHVSVSHFAIGGGFYLTLTEYYAVKKNDSEMLKYLKLHSRFFSLLTLVYGAMTGVGIWFTIGLINPSATSSLIHNFVWIWALEWIFFFLEVLAALVYYLTWDRVSQKTHFMVGWVYFITSFMSVVLINGILTFMLTPGIWIETGYVWDGFFNPTFIPSFFVRIAICIALAGIYALVTGPFIKDKLARARLIRYSAFWALTGILLAIPFYAYYNSLLPLDPNEIFTRTIPTTFNAAMVLLVSGFSLLVLVFVPILFPRRFRFLMGLVLLMLGWTAFGSSEFIRESVRKPYTIYGYMYGNQLRVDEYDAVARQGGLLASAIFVKNREPAPTADAGDDVFRVACRSCHALNSYKSLRKTMKGLNEEFIVEVIKRLDRLLGKMPPFPGTDIEAAALARYLVSTTDPDYRITTGKEAFDRRCGICHNKDREYRALYPILQHHTYESLFERIPTLGSMQEKMAPWSGTGEEAEMLTRYIMSWYEDGTNQREGGQ